MAHPLLMLHPDITTLYKYMRVSPYALEALRSDLFWFARPGTFNDPFDCALNVAADTLEESVRHALQRAMLEPGYAPGTIDPAAPISDSDRLAFEEFRDSLGAQFAEMGLFCLCEAPDDLLMWSHYADSHQGFCVGFLRADDNPLGDDAEPVRYETDYPRLAVSHFDPKVYPDSFSRMWLTKSKRWSYEREWRLMRTHGDQACSIFSPITKIIFGAKLTAANRDLIRAALVDRVTSPTFFQAHKSKTSFELNLEQIS